MFNIQPPTANPGGEIRMFRTADGVWRKPAPMTDGDLERAAPAALAVEQHDSRSDKYQPIPTMDVVEALRKATGVEVYGASQAGTSKKDRIGYTKHVLRLRRPEDAGSPDAPELLLTNSYDGSSSYRLDLGVYRQVCANGLVVGSTWDSVRVRHIGEDAIPEMIDGSKRLARLFVPLQESIALMRQTPTSDAVRMVFARNAIALRHHKDDQVDPRAVLQPKRSYDRETDLWSTLNVLQENLLRGGYERGRPDSDGVIQSRRVRAITGQDQNAEFNRQIWTLAEQIREASQLA